MKHLTLSALTLLLTLWASSATAQDAKLYDWPDATAPVVIISDKGAIFLHKDGKPYRTYDWRSNKGALSAHVSDIDGDGKPEIVGAGTPTFAIDTNGDPLWSIKKGCKIALVGDMAFDEKKEILCSDKRSLKVITHDNQQAWEMSLGRSFSDCALGDTNGDLKADIECKVGKKIARIDGNGTLITAEGDDSLINSEPYEAFAAVGEEVTTAKQTFDFDKNGTADEYIVFEDTLLVVKSKSNPKPLSMFDPKGKVTALLVKDLDADGTLEIVALTDKAVFVLSPDGKRQERFDLSAKRYKRSPVADLQSVYANGFEDNDAAREVITGMSGALAKCYAKQVKKSAFAGSGQLLLELKVDEKGKVTKANTMHSEIADDGVVSCAKKTLQKAKLPKVGEAKAATINVTMTFTFRDQ